MKTYAYGSIFKLPFKSSSKCERKCCICIIHPIVILHFSPNGDVDKNEIADHSWKLDHKFDWENKIIIDREQNWRVRKIKETIHSISDKNHINSISYSLPEIWLPALKKPYGN